MVACPSCGVESPDGFRFCPGCGSPLSAQAAPTPAPEERKVVTALFCDLVGFTAASEAADPEDIDRMLRQYFAMARFQIEAHGGVVEKFIGDAVLGVFGVPAAHEDDPERAVRAALRICEDTERLPGLAGAPLRLRVGINTGEALVRLGVVPGSGERFLAGDAINTASRIQSAAPEMGVAVGQATYESTKGIFDYIELPPASLKGKAERVRVFHARSPLARLGVDLTRTHGSPYVGRATDLGLLNGLFDKSVEGSSVQLVTIVGEPGIGKSRIVAELLSHAQLRAPQLTWRQGRCLPYGDGVTFWALGEIVKAQAGILETDAPAVAGTKIDEAVPAGPDRDWLRQRLRPLVGVDASSSAEREELFAAWRTFFEVVAEAQPTVLVFEDIHWADDAMLAFLEHLADRAEGVPLLVVATARPELFERHATFAAGLPNVNRINLAPLSDEETGRLVSGLLGAVVPPELQGPILERAEGNPLYAEEFVRLVRDRDLLIEAGGAVALRMGAEIPLPDSIGALIAARLDTLPAKRKAMLADAAVVGKVFWAGAVAAMGERDVLEVNEAMRELARKELVRPARHSSMAGEAEYAFWHVLTRDVAYAQLPRPSRATRHVAAAEWLEAKAGQRVEDIAEVVAYHYATALDLDRAAGLVELASVLEPRALRYLTLAGEKAMTLDIAAAEVAFKRALELAPEGHPSRAQILVFLANVERTSGKIAEAIALLREGIASYTSLGDRKAADEAILRLDGVLHASGDPLAGSQIDEIIRRLQPAGPSELLADAYSTKQFYDHSQPWADRALAIAVELDLPIACQHALNMRGLDRANRGDPGGIDDLRAALALAMDQMETRATQAAYVNLSWALKSQDPLAALDVADAGVAFDRSRGAPRSQSGPIRQWPLLALGRWDEVLDAGAEMVRLAEPLGDRWTIRYAAAPMTIVLACRGMAEAALELARTASDDAYETRGLFALSGVVAHRTLGATAEAEQSLADAVSTWVDGADGYHGCDFAREMVYLDRLDQLERLLALPGRTMKSAASAQTTWRAIAAEAGGRGTDALDLYRDAAAGWLSFGDPYEQAHALLGCGRTLIGLDRGAEAIGPLREARAIFEQLGATPAVVETDAQLSQATVQG